MILLVLATHFTQQMGQCCTGEKDKPDENNTNSNKRPRAFDTVEPEEPLYPSLQRSSNLTEENPADTPEIRKLRTELANKQKYNENVVEQNAQ